jgi:hypothetical protein
LLDCCLYISGSFSLINTVNDDEKPNMECLPVLILSYLNDIDNY